MNIRDQYLSNLSDIYLKLTRGGYTIPSGTHHYLYQITNNLNGKIYLGRRSSHVPDHEDDYMGSGLYLYSAIKKYGIQNFTKTVLHICPTFEELCALEQTIVNQEFVDRPDTYNQITGGLGYGNPSIHNKRKNSKSNLGRVISLEHRVRLSEALTGIVRSESTRLKMSISSTGKLHSDKTKILLSELALKRNNRPWKNARLNSDNLKAWSKLDLIYTLYIKYDFKYWSVLFERDVLQNLGVYPTGAMLEYFRKYGDPVGDSEWVLFKSRYYENLFPNKFFQNSR